MRKNTYLVSFMLRSPGRLLLCIGLTGISLVSLLLFTEHLQAQEERPNIILIVTDDQGYQDLSSYGAPNLQTPNMDRIVESGMRFTHFYSNSSVCAPTRASVVTGRYPDLVGVPGLIRPNDLNTWGYLSPDATLISSLLHKTNYHTAAFGKWNLGFESPNVPQDRGFNYSYVHLADNLGDYYTHRRAGRNYMRENGKTIDPEGHGTDLFADAVVDYIRRRSEYDSPFFMYYAPAAPHFPIQPPDDVLEKVKKREDDISDSQAKYIALLEHLDSAIGRVLDTLKETGQYENTLILFTSDNGGSKNHGSRVGSLRGQKGQFYEGGIRVPMAASWPGHIPAGTETDLVALTMDLFPTIADAAGVKISHTIDGSSFLPTLLGEEQPSFEDRTLFFVRREGARWSDWAGRAAYAVREGKWKLLQNHPSEPFELYNLEKDPNEQKNLIDKRQKVFKRLERKLRHHIKKASRVPFSK